MPEALTSNYQLGSDNEADALLRSKRQGYEAKVPKALTRNHRLGSDNEADALSRKPGYMLNVMRGLAPHEEYVTYMEEFLISGTLPKNEFKEQVRLEAPHFLIEEGRLMRRISEGVTTPYLEWEFRGDLIQRMHEEYGHLSQQGMRDLVRTRAWWPKSGQRCLRILKNIKMGTKCK